jgi:TolA-binding protein
VGSLAVGGLTACSSTKQPDNAPTLKSLETRQYTVPQDSGIVASEEKAIAAYRDFLKAAPYQPQRPEALRRLGDLEMDRAESGVAGDTAAQPAGGVAPLAARPTTQIETKPTAPVAPSATSATSATSAASAASAAQKAAADLKAAQPTRAKPNSGAEPDLGGGDYRQAIARYSDYLKNYPNDPSNDRVLYQMARAYEQSGDLDRSMKTLDRLVQNYPSTAYRDEAQFRRGEMLFATRDYAGAESAYGTVLRNQASPFHERSLYMHGWALFKQSRLEEALGSFFAVLDRKLGTPKSEADLEASLETMPGLTRGDRELVEDTFRVASLSLENLQGAATIPRYVKSVTRRNYEFRVYEQLGELYLKQERIKDAADTFAIFARNQPLHLQAPQFQARVIDIYQRGGFATLALEAKKEYVERYGVRSEFRRVNMVAWERAQPLVKTHLSDLARHYHASAQKNKKPEDYKEAVRWYRAFLDSFPSDPQAALNNFLLAELLYEDGQFSPLRYVDAAIEYEKAAYGYKKHEKSADAGYGALLAYGRQEKHAGSPDAVKKVQLAGVDSALRFARAFPEDARTAPVLTHASERLYALRDERAAAVAQQVLNLQPPAPPAQRRVAWTVIAHTAFDANAYDRAERGYSEVLALTPEKDAARADLSERLAASIYKQGEQARGAGNLRDAVGHFARVAVAAPLSTIRSAAQYDAAAAYIGLKEWDSAARLLEDFRRRFPNHALQDEAGGKLAVVYSEKGQWSLAAAEFERLAATKKDPKLARDALWHAAELYEKGGTRAQAAAAYERYVKQYPDPFELAMEARYRLAGLAKTDGNTARELAWMRQLLQADQAAGRARTDRTRYLGATAALALAQPVYDDYRRIALVEPLKKQLKLKKAKMEDVLKAYTAAADYGVADVATAAAYQIAELYRDFGRALLESQRPKGLSKIELEQYNVLLEEQAFPFEEKALEVHELNARRSSKGIYDKWVKSSYAALAKLRPVRFGKIERGEVTIDAIR